MSWIDGGGTSGFYQGDKCDICKVDEQVDSLKDAYATPQIRFLCNGCAREVDRLHSNMTDLFYSWREKQIKRIVSAMRSKKNRRFGSARLRPWTWICNKCKGRTGR